MKSRLGGTQAAVDARTTRNCREREVGENGERARRPITAGILDGTLSPATVTGPLGRAQSNGNLAPDAKS